MNPESAPPTCVLDVALITELRPALISFFKRRCGSVVEAEDLAQDVLARAFSHANWRSPEEAKGYIFKMAANRWRDRGRRLVVRGSTLPLDTAGDLLPHEEIEPSRVISYRDELTDVVGRLMELGERTRDIFILFRLERMSQPQIAEMFSISASAVEKHIAKAAAYLSTVRPAGKISGE